MSFKENFIKLCNQQNESPSSVCKKVNITAATFSCWTDESVPRKATLMRIADYFGVTVDDLLAEPKPKEKLPESNEEIIEMLRQHNKGKAQLFFCGANGKVVDVPPDAESLILDLIETLNKNKK